MNEFRDRLLRGKRTETPLLKAKGPRPADMPVAEEESFSELVIPRETHRQSDHRDGDRHRLDQERAILKHKGRGQAVTLVNLSGGGAMIEGAKKLRLWDRVELQLGDWHRVEGAVRWIKGDRIGLEFAHETGVDTGSDELAQMLRVVLQRSFPDIAIAALEPPPPAAAAPAAEAKEPAENAREHDERELRHPLIWSGEVHYAHETTPVRLRNISSGGALIEASAALPVGAELLLDLGDAGTIFGTVVWAHGDAAGLKFHSAYDVRNLAKARPEIAGARWVAPDYLRSDRSSDSPWASHWGRSDLAGLHRKLGSPRS